ncbi:hypothetical protein FNF27_03476 [Cafeteria roenbergensis]|uniref:Kinesin motor domain-containing protein n=1 Tax=Cafeteria roenbergensis TaxID=33653 RepID=A0A5A8CQJ0_CAFRO|nr:hypothetical protein FNF29_02326 [Cafeteria roenbergensis]KAA0174944.1 hypothetical protein FNF27_03476 [Cafeteria roenbergensis]|eukprot:KAA0154797.1 hypothetical protein FNF29_02326 [Cafeteria roenbergensis]
MDSVAVAGERGKVATLRRQQVVRPTNILVGVRARPLSEVERAADDEDAWIYEGGDALWETTVDGEKLRRYAFDYAFEPPTGTSQVYASLGVPIVEAVMEGYHGTVFAYGQTGSGKTFTLMGAEEQPGMTVLAIHDCFQRIERAIEEQGAEFHVRVSYLEIYNENILDLLNPSGGARLTIGHDPVSGPHVKGLTEEVVLSYDRVIEILRVGERNRHVTSTRLNMASSRSHTLFRMVIEAAFPHGDAFAHGAPHPCLNMVDLAGSENVKRSGASGQQVKEAGHINTSLVTLGTVISKLVEGAEHVPYRDSKLTRLLSSSLGGNARTAVVVTMSPSGRCVPETRRSLQFALRAMRVVNKARVNEVADRAALVEQLRREIAELRAALVEGGGGMVVTKQGEMVSAEEMLRRMHEYHEQERARIEEEGQAEAARADAGARTASELAHLAFAAAHAVAKLEAAPTAARLNCGTSIRPSATPRREQELSTARDPTRSSRRCAPGDGREGAATA